MRRKIFHSKTYNYALCIVHCALILGCGTDDAPTNIEPTLHVLDATDITRTRATLHGAIDLADGAIEPELRFVYGSSEAMEKSSSLLSDDSIAIRINGLMPGTTYYFALKGTRGNASLLSTALSFTTNPNVRPQLGEIELLSTGPLSVIVGYEIADNGGEDVSSTGCRVKNLSTGKSRTISMAAAGGNVKLRIDSLERYTTYEISPFAANSIGETVGSAISYTTADAITLEKAGELTLLVGGGMAEYKSLSIAGEINGSDVACLRVMTVNGNLSSLDLADAKIVSGGDTYGCSRYTEDDAITYGMFGDCSRLETIVLPDNVRRIDHEAFINCTGLTTLTIPASAISVSTSSGCVGLTTIKVSSANGNFKSIDGVLYNSDATSLLWFPLGKQGEYEIPSTVTTIEDRAFEGCAIQKLILPDNITEIGMAAFHNSKIEEVWLPDKLKLLPTATFQGCTSLTTVHLGSCTQLIGEYAFDGCPLADLYVSAETPPVCYDNSFASTDGDIVSTCILHVPIGSKQTYRNHKYWGQFKTISEQ